MKKNPVNPKPPRLIYVYVLVDENEFKKNGRNVIKSALYVGKGIGARMHEHIREAKQALADSSNVVQRINQSKVQKLVEMLERGSQISAFRISAGYSSDKDAFLAESLAITLINSSRGDNNKLLNAVSGHNSVPIADMATHFLFAGSKVERLPAIANELAILVKTTDKESATDHFVPLKKKYIYKGEPVNGISVMTLGRTKKPRRAWNPINPWTDLEAIDRARHYWPFSIEKIMNWLSSRNERPRYLFAAVPDGMNSVVRYIWEIDWDSGVEFHPFQKDGKTGKWGFNLFENQESPPSRNFDVCRKKYLGTVLKEDRKGKEVQVLSGYSMGTRLIGI